MVRLRQSSVASERLRDACGAELSRRNLRVDAIKAKIDGADRWTLTVTIGGRTFHFGTLGRERFYFVEIAADREDDLTAALPPSSQDPAVLWRYAFWLLETALNAPAGRVLEQMVI